MEFLPTGEWKVTVEGWNMNWMYVIQFLFFPKLVHQLLWGDKFLSVQLPYEHLALVAESINTGQGERWALGGELEKLQDPSPLSSSAIPEEHSRLKQCPWWPNFLSLLQESQVPSEREDSIDLQTEKWDIGAAGSMLGKGLQHNTPCCPYPSGRCSLYLWLHGSIPPGIFPCSPRHVSARVGSLDTHSEPSHPAPYPSQTSWKASFAPSSRSLELLPVPLSLPPSLSSLLLKLWFLSLSYCCKPGPAKTLWLALSGAGWLCEGRIGKEGANVKCPIGFLHCG